MFAGFDKIDWDRLLPPPENEPETIPHALRALASTAENGDDITYHRLHNAVGNDHNGSYLGIE